MNKLNAFITALCASFWCPSDADVAYQIAIEMFDESRDTTVCTYRSRAGDFKVVERDGPYFCPRVLRAADTNSDDDAASMLGHNELFAVTL